MKPRPFHCALVAVTCIALGAVVFWPRPALSRPGGGQTFSAGTSRPSHSPGPSPPSGVGDHRSSAPHSDSSWSSPEWDSHTSSRPSSSSTTGSPLLDIIVALIVGIVTAVVAVLRAAVRLLEDWTSGISWSSSTSKSTSTSPPHKPFVLPTIAPARLADLDIESHASIEAAFADLDAKDPNFSRAVFEDFLYALFAEVHAARGSGRIDYLEPYLSEVAIRSMHERQVLAVRDIIIGAMQITKVGASGASRSVHLTVVFTANYSEENKTGEQSYFTEEAWRLSRSADATSRLPERARAIGCPSCGAPLREIVGRKCRYCNEIVGYHQADGGEATACGRFDWRVDAIDEVRREERAPMLTGTTEEVGTNEPTVVAPDAQQRFGELSARDPALSWAGFGRRVDLVFHAFHEAWSRQDLTGARPYLSDSLYETQRYWVEAYKAQRLRNITDRRAIVSIVLSRATRDAFFDAMTVRVFAECLHYTIDEAGAVVGGSKESLRRFSEYWTLLRSKSRTGAPRTEPGCPNCGAPTGAINMAGTCASCGRNITRGEFDWVLSRIEQDEVFRL